MSASLTVTLVEAISVSGEYNLKASYFSVEIAGGRSADRLCGARIGVVSRPCLHRASSAQSEKDSMLAAKSIIGCWLFVMKPVLGRSRSKIRNITTDTLRQ